MTSARRGFTLWELVLVLSLLAIVTALSLPAFTDLGATSGGRSNDVLALLHDVRRLAVTRGSPVSVVLDPESRHYRVDTMSAAGRIGAVADTTLDLPMGTMLEADSARVYYYFYATGAAIADTLRMRANGRTMIITVDPWDGVARADTT